MRSARSGPSRAPGMGSRCSGDFSILAVPGRASSLKARRLEGHHQPMSRFVELALAFGVPVAELGLFPGDLSDASPQRVAWVIAPVPGFTKRLAERVHAEFLPWFERACPPSEGGVTGDSKQFECQMDSRPSAGLWRLGDEGSDGESIGSGQRDPLGHFASCRPALESVDSGTSMSLGPPRNSRGM